MLRFCNLAAGENVALPTGIATHPPDSAEAHFINLLSWGDVALVVGDDDFHTPV